MRWLGRLFARRDPGGEAEPTDAGAHQEMGATWPTGQDTGHPYRRAERTGRVLAILLGLSLGVNALQAGLIGLMLPLKAYVPYFLQTRPFREAVVRVRPLTQEGHPLRVATATWIREWVRRREEILPDSRAMTANVRWVRARATVPVFERFTGKRDAVVEAMRGGFTRQVTIHDVVRQSRGFYLVSFATRDARDGEVVDQQNWNAAMRVDYRAVDLTVETIDDESAVNPFGFTVTSYRPRKAG